MVTGRFDKGVGFYTTAEVTVQVHFPENDVSCQWCRFLRYDRGLDRYYCGLTDMLLYSKLTVPEYCPLEPITLPAETDPVPSPVVEASVTDEDVKPKRRSHKKNDAAPVD